MKMQSLIKEHMISKRWGVIYSDHLEYDFPKDEGDESDPITFQQYLADMNVNMGKYTGDQLFHEISQDNYPTTVNFIFFLLIRWNQPRFSMDHH